MTVREQTLTQTTEQLVLPVVPLRDSVLFPGVTMPLRVGRPVSVQAIEAAATAGQRVLILGQREPAEEVRPEILPAVGTIALLAQAVRLPDGTLQVLVQGEQRAQVVAFVQTAPFLAAAVQALEEPTVAPSLEVEALLRTVREFFDRYVELSGAVPEEAVRATRALTAPGALADALATLPEFTTAERQEVLETLDPVARLTRVAQLLSTKLEVLALSAKIKSEVQKGVEKSQRDYLLREQLKAIQRELGEHSPEEALAQELRAKIEAAGMPEAVRERALREVERLTQMPLASPETAVIRTYVEWLVSLPWSVRTEDNLDLKKAAEILDAEHEGLTKVKERILEYLAVRKLNANPRAPILCFVGPPGVGKTSLGRSIAQALGRRFVRISLGGVHDEAEIRGHRRTYVGALPGRIIQGMRTAGAKNPVFVLDELDKVGVDFRGDPAAALLEVLDPEQNHAFSDHYLEVPFDLSEVIFIATANVLDTIPPALRDRLEVISLPGYTEEEKLAIARKHLVPRQVRAHGLTPEQVRFAESALREIITGYTREAGVRNLDRAIGDICRKVARRIAEGQVRRVVVRARDVARYLGPRRFEHEVAEAADAVGVATGLAWTPVGGDVLFVEVSVMPGRRELILTGQLGEVMKESATAALSYARAHAAEWGIAPHFFERHAIHIHVPAGAIPKDGPSAGITMATALISALTGRPVRRDVAMTGEITLRGRVLPIGGVKEKLLAAQRAGITTVILPAKNRKDLVDVPASVLRSLRLVFVEHLDEVLRVALRAADEEKAA